MSNMLKWEMDQNTAGKYVHELQSKSAKTNVTILGHILLHMEAVGLDLQSFWSLTEAQLFRVVTHIKVNWDTKGNREDVIRKTRSVVKYMPHIVITGKLEPLKVLWNKATTMCKEPKHDRFWDVQKCMTLITPSMIQLMAAIPQRVQWCSLPKATIDNLVCLTRPPAIFHTRLSLLMRTLDVNLVISWKHTEEGTLWLFLLRKNAHRFHWEPLLPNKAHRERCPVFWFTTHMALLTQLQHWDERARNQPGKTLSVWRISTQQQGTGNWHTPCSANTLGNSAKDSAWRH